jgi:ribosomal-protein-alanine N-acetyltransferase
LSLPPFLLEGAREDDLEALLLLERSSFSHPWTEGHFRDEVPPHVPGALLVLRARWDLLPPRGILAYCAYRVAGDELNILNLAVAPAWRRRGLARFLLRFALEAGSRAGARRAFLEVRPSNKAALALYRGLGFTVLALRPAYYSDPPEDALVLVRSELPRGGPRGAGDDP